MSKAKRQMPGQPGRVGAVRGETADERISDGACGPPREHQFTGPARPKAGTGGLLEAALTRENLHRAWKRVKANKGAAGVDGLDIEQTAHLLRTSWPQTRQALLAGTYRLECLHCPWATSAGWPPPLMPRACALCARRAQTVHWTVCARALSPPPACGRRLLLTSLRGPPDCRSPPPSRRATVESKTRWLRRRAWLGCGAHERLSPGEEQS